MSAFLAAGQQSGRARTISSDIERSRRMENEERRKRVNRLDEARDDSCSDPSICPSAKLASSARSARCEREESDSSPLERIPDSCRLRSRGPS